MAETAPIERVLHDPRVRGLGDLFTRAGHELWIVGGSVRDLLLDVESDDLDFTTDARPHEIKEAIAAVADHVWTVGERFGTIGAELTGRKVEITTFRSEVYVPESRKPEVRFGSSILDDLERRDFTCNAMAISIPEGKLIDPFGGVKDLAAHRLVTPALPEESFSEDPLRMLRAARFVGQLGLEPTTAVRGAMAALAERLRIVSVERIRDEFSKIMVLGEITPALWLLVDTRLFEEFMPEIPAMRVEQDPVHRHKDVLTHSIAVTQKTSPRLVLRLAALMHDIAKPATRSVGPSGVQFHHHDVVGAKMVRKRLKALKYPREVVDDVAHLVWMHLRVHTYKMGWSDSALRRYVRDAGAQLEDLNELIRCDCTTRSERRARELQARMDELEARVGELREREELAKLRPALDGRQVMVHLDLAPGPEVGRALDFLMEIRLEEGEIEEEEAYRRLDAWWAGRGAH
ncbi:MAG: CCA tRNA nucleotidyltransferase [Acidimicrobiia bacterium]|nr:CCA tRNA nucleotidyltransferase [Acidimicrobiia bacterium]